MNKHFAQALMWAVTGLLIWLAYTHARPIVDTAVGSIFKLTLGAHIGLAVEWYIRMRTNAPNDDPRAPLRMALLAGAGMLAMAGA